MEDREKADKGQASSPIAWVRFSEKTRLNTPLYTPTNVQCDSRDEIPFLDPAERILLLAPFSSLAFRLSCSSKQFQTQNNSYGDKEQRNILRVRNYILLFAVNLFVYKKK